MAHLATTVPDSATRRALGRVIGRTLVDLATSGAESVLRLVLTPDPGEQDIVWTVRCFEAGAIVPALVRDFAACVDAVAAVGSSDDDAQLFAELVASSPLGLRWTALTRTGRDVSFELPDAMTLTDANGRQAEALARAFVGWDTRLVTWANGAGAPPARTATPAPAPAPAPTIEDATPMAPRPAPATEVRAIGAEAAPSVAALEQEVASMRLDATRFHTALQLMAERFAAVVVGIEEMHVMTAGLRDTIADLRAEVRELRDDAVGRAAPEPTATLAALAPRELPAAMTLSPTAIAGLHVGAALHEALHELLAGLRDDLDGDAQALAATLNASVADVESRLGRRIERLAAAPRADALPADAPPADVTSLPVRVRVS